MSLAGGQGVAAATPSDSSGSSQSAQTSESSETSRGPTAAPPSDAPDAGPAEGADVGVAGASADDSEIGIDDTGQTGEADRDEAVGLEDSTPPAVTAETDADGVTDVDTDIASSGVGGETPRQSRQSEQSLTLDDVPAADGPTGAAGESRADAAGNVAAEAVARAGIDMPAAEPDEVESVVAVPAPARMQLAAPPVAPSSATLRDLVSARPVTVDTIVTDLLTWVGLRPLANGLPTPAAPVSALVQALWLAVRETQYTLNNQRPTAAATLSGPGPDGMVSGSLNAVDFDDTTLTYRVTGAPTSGSVVVDALGNFTYTPTAVTSVRGDSFTVTIDDTIGNPFHVHGLLGALGITGPTEVTIVIAPSAAGSDGPVSVELSDLLARDGVEVTVNPSGAVRVIDGRFTDHVVGTAADAAAVLNELAPVLGAAAGFADPAAVTTAHAGLGNSVENFYRLNETVGGIKVLGSDIVLVTDADGAVTGLFNNYRGLAQGFDVTPAAAVDEDVEVYTIAGTAYLGSGADGDAVEAFLSENTFTNQLIVYALDDEAPASLAWRVVVRLPDAGDMSRPGRTYLIDADGADAGTIIASISNVADASSMIEASDRLGEQRTITIDSSRFLFWTTETMIDATRKIETYNTSYPLFGLIGARLPGSVVKRGWFGWDRGAVSAHANTAVVYDYYEDVLGRTSFDGAGAPITVSLRYNPGLPIFGGYANAFWDPGLQQFGYGDSGYLQSALDIVGHEFTHAVVDYVVGEGGAVLDYGEPGALNEAYADILGALIEGKSGQDRWLIGEDAGQRYLRNLANPASRSTPQGVYRAHYANRYTGSGDEGGEHVNSTIFSHAAYKMMTAVATGGISDETWATVFYQSLYRLSPGAVFVDGRAAVLSAATAQGFTNVQLDAISAAFDSVGIIGAAASSAIAA